MCGMGSVTYDLDSRRHRHNHSRHQDQQRDVAGGVRVSLESVNENVVLAMSRDELTQTVELAVQRGFEDAIGLYLETRQDKEDVKADFRFLRAMRRAFNGLSLNVGKTIVTLFVGGVALIIWLGVKAYVLK